MFNATLYEKLQPYIGDPGFYQSTADIALTHRISANIAEITDIFYQLYAHHENAGCFPTLIETIIKAHSERSRELRNIDYKKLNQDRTWFLDHKIVGMSLYADRFSDGLRDLSSKLDYLQELGVNLIHLMPVMESPSDGSDGGYAVSNFRKVDSRFGSIEDLVALREEMQRRNMYLMIDIVLNHTSKQHEWAHKASEGDKYFQDFFYMYDSRELPDQFEKTMPDVFPESSPGSFTFDRKSGKWVMTVFNHYQWDLNFTNPQVFVAMLDNIFFYANIGVDILRIDAPAFIWKSLGTTCQNLPEAHKLLQLIKLCVQVAAPGMALLGEAIVASKEIMRYFGTGPYLGKECDVAYGATHMALQWDAIATGDTRIMMGSQHDIMQKPYGVTWINYTRCHDDIGLGYEDSVISSAGFDPFEHRSFLKNYYSGGFVDSPARGALFGVNEKTNDARISGTLASLCGLESAINANDEFQVTQSINKIVLMQGMSLLMGGIPMLFYGDEVGNTNDYSYLDDAGKSYDNRWMHRPLIQWKKNDLRKKESTPEAIIFHHTQRLIQIRKSDPIFSDVNNLYWLEPRSHHVIGFVRSSGHHKVFCIFNYSTHEGYLPFEVLAKHGLKMGQEVTDIWNEVKIMIGTMDQYIKIGPYQILILLA